MTLHNLKNGASWHVTLLCLANRCWRTIAKGIIQSNVILKNVLDKYWQKILLPLMLLLYAEFAMSSL